MPDFNTVPAVNAAYFFNMRHILMCAGFYVVVNFVPDLLNYSAPNFISHASRFTRAGFLMMPFFCLAAGFSVNRSREPARQLPISITVILPNMGDTIKINLPLVFLASGPASHGQGRYEVVYRITTAIFYC